MTAPYYYHAPGFPSRWAIIDVGLKCVHSCRWCYYSYLDGSDDQFSGMRRAKFFSKEHLITFLDTLKEEGFLGFDVTGGEPTLHPNIVEVIEYATKIGLASRIITLGQWLVRGPKNRNLLDDLIHAGLTNFLLSLHAVERESFFNLTGGSWEKMLSAMTQLDAMDFHYTTNTVIFEENYRQAPDIAREILKHKVYMSNFLFMNAYYEWSAAGRAAPVQARYSEAAKYVKEAIDILEEGGVGVNARFAPLCTMKGYEKNLVGIVGIRHDPQETMNDMRYTEEPQDPRLMGRRIRQLHDEPAPGADLIEVSGTAGDHPVFAGRGGNGGIAKVFPEKCSGCGAILVCDGIDQNYLERHGPDELESYGSAIRGRVLDQDRLKYVPGFLVKLRQDADMMAVTSKFLRR